MCNASKQQKDAAKAVKDFSSQLVGQATQIFGDASQVFNTLSKAYTGIVDAGPSQHGFSQAELNTMNAQAKTQAAAEYRGVAGAAKAGQAAFGGGNTVTQSGATTAANLGIAEAQAAKTSDTLSNITQKDYEAGRENFFAAGQGLSNATNTFNPATTAAGEASKELDKNYEDQTQLGQAAGWWQKPVMGLVNAGLNIASGGITGMLGNVTKMAGSAGGSGGGAGGFGGGGDGGGLF